MQKAVVSLLRTSTKVDCFRAASHNVDTTSTLEPVPKISGRVQFWRPPAYVGPFTNPLQRGPDYKVVGGVRPIATHQWELTRLRHQLQLNKEIVQCLNEIKEAEALFDADQKNKNALESEKLRWTPSAKTAVEIY